MGADERRVRVIVADDSADVRMVLAMRASAWPIDIVGEAADGREALDMTTRFQPDVLILDNEMPERRGIEIIPELRARAPRTRIVMFLSYTGSGPYCIDAGADAWVAKLSPWDDLFDLVIELSEDTEPMPLPLSERDELR